MRYIQAIQRLSAVERQALSELYLEARERWNAANRPAVSDYCNERAGDLWDEAKRQELATRALEQDFLGVAAELSEDQSIDEKDWTPLDDDDEDQSAYAQPSEDLTADLSGLDNEVDVVRGPGEVSGDDESAKPYEDLSDDDGKIL